MTKQLQLGLVVEGKTDKSAVLRLPTIVERMGPVKSGNIRVARRISNFLRAGYAVERFDDLQAARTILVRVPDEAVGRTVDDLCASEVVLEGMSFILCESWLASDVLKPLGRRGASVATVVEVAAANRSWFVTEGDPVATRQIRRIIETGGEAHAFELRPGAKSLYFAAELLATALPVPFFLAAEDALRAGGISGNHLHTLLREIGEKAFRDLLKGARVTWGGPLTECSPETAEAHLSALREARPALAEIVDRQLAWASGQMRKGKPVPVE
jgi:predicted short-subunit dehydrogenase-like oxidoreductase (DUF2520 family)